MGVRRLALAAITAGLAFGPGDARAAALPVRPYLPLALAQDAASAALARCKADGFSIVVFVLDRAGEPIVMLRGDRTSPHHVDSARRKAYTALTFKMPSGDLAAFIERDPSTAGLKDMAGVIAFAGGLPIISGTDVVGSIGVAGAWIKGATGEKEADVVCARAGLDSIASRLK